MEKTTAAPRRQFYVPAWRLQRRGWNFTHYPDGCSAVMAILRTIVTTAAPWWQFYVLAWRLQRQVGNFTYHCDWLQRRGDMNLHNFDDCNATAASVWTTMTTAVTWRKFYLPLWWQKHRGGKNIHNFNGCSDTAEIVRTTATTAVPRRQELLLRYCWRS